MSEKKKEKNRCGGGHGAADQLLNWAFSLADETRTEGRLLEYKIACILTLLNIIMYMYMYMYEQCQ